MNKVFIVVAVALLLSACLKEDSADKASDSFESTTINGPSEALILDTVQISKKLASDKKGLIITTTVQISPSEYEIYVFTDSDRNGTLDKVYDYQLYEDVEVTDYHRKIFKKAYRSLLVVA